MSAHCLEMFDLPAAAGDDLTAGELFAQADAEDHAKGRRAIWHALSKDDFDTEFRGRLMRYADGKPAGVYGITQDITERERARAVEDRGRQGLESRRFGRLRDRPLWTNSRHTVRPNVGYARSNCVMITQA
jgi:hypothetical protein